MAHSPALRGRHGETTEASLGDSDRVSLYLENRLNFDSRARWDLRESQRAAGVITVAGFTVKLVQQVATTVNDEVLFGEIWS